MPLSRYRTIILALLAGIAIALLLVSQIVVQMIDTEAVMRPLQQAAKEITGQPLIIENVSAKLFTSLTVEVDKVAIRHPIDTSKPYVAYADKLVMHLRWSDLFADNPMPSRIDVIGLKLHFETKADGGKSWRALKPVQQRLSSFPVPLELMLQNASVTYTDLQANEAIEVAGIYGPLAFDAQGIKAALSGNVMDKPMHFSGDCRVSSFEHFSNYDAQCKLQAKADGMESQADYRVVRTAAGLQLRGTVSAQAQDARFWADAFTGHQGKHWQQRIAKPLAASVSAETFSDPSRLIVNMSQLKFEESHGKGRFSIQKQDETSVAKVQMAFDMLDVDALKQLFHKTPMPSSSPETNSTQAKAAQLQLFPSNISGAMQLSAKNVRYNGLELLQLSASGALEKGQISLPQITGLLPGEGRFLAMGRVIAAAQGVQFEGSVEAAGQSLSQLAPLFGATQTPASQQLFKHYRARFNCSLNPQGTILSELRLLVNDNVRIAGGISLQNTEKTDLTGSLSFENFVLTPLWHEWLGSASLLSEPTADATSPLRFAWLPTQPLHVDLLLRLKNLQLPYDATASGQVRLKMAPEVLELDAMALQLNEMQVSGNTQLTVKPNSERPYITTKLNVSQLALGNWLRSATWRQPDEKPDGTAPSVWSKTPFNFHPLRYFDGLFELGANSVMHDAFTASNARVSAELNASQLTIRDWSMRLWDGDLRASGSIDVRSLPGISLIYRHDAMDAQALLKTFFGRDNVTGRISMVHTIKTYGVNFHEWMQQLTGGIKFESQQLSVEELNLMRLMQLLSTARSVSELPNVMRQTESGGGARFSQLQGVTYYEGGKLKTTKISLASNGISGDISALLNIMDWTMDSSIRLGFISLGSGNAMPQLGLRFTGAIDASERSLNLKSLESYIAQKPR